MKNFLEAELPKINLVKKMNLRNSPRTQDTYENYKTKSDAEGLFRRSKVDIQANSSLFKTPGVRCTSRVGIWGVLER